MEAQSREGTLIWAPELELLLGLSKEKDTETNSLNAEIVITQTHFQFLKYQLFWRIALCSQKAWLLPCWHKGASFKGFNALMLA